MDQRLIQSSNTSGRCRPKHLQTVIRSEGLKVSQADLVELSQTRLTFGIISPSSSSSFTRCVGAEDIVIETFSFWPRAIYITVVKNQRNGEVGKIEKVEQRKELSTPLSDRKGPDYILAAQNDQ